MEQKYLMFLFGFEVVLRDRRDGQEMEGFIVIPFPEKHPEELKDTHDTIKRYYGRLGFDVEGIEHQESRVTGISRCIRSSRNGNDHRRGHNRPAFKYFVMRNCNRHDRTGGHGRNI